MEIDFNIPLKALNGDPLENVSTKETIANMLLNPQLKDGTAVKKYSLAQKIYNEGKIDIDKDDYDLIMNALKSDNCGIIPLAQAQLIMVLDGKFNK